jgi:hypothetical protein
LIRKRGKMPIINLTDLDAEDLIETLKMAADDLDTEGLGDSDSCVFARRWAKRLEDENATTPQKGKVK